MNRSKLDRVMDGLFLLGIPMADLIVYKDHHEIYRRMVGRPYENKITPMTGDELYFFYSATKMYTCCAILQLAEKGLLSLSDPVSAYLPAYDRMTVREGDHDRPACTVMTIRHLLGMQSGMNYDISSRGIRNALKKYGPDATTKQLVGAMAGNPLDFDPGTDYQYSLSHDVLAAVVEVVSGQRFSEYLEQNIFTPLGITDMSFRTENGRLDRICDQYIRDENTGTTSPCVKANKYRLSVAYESGGAGLNGRTDEYVLFLDALACGGVGKNGNRILSEETVKMWSSVRSDGKPMETFHNLRGKLGYNYGLGVRVMEHCCNARALSPDGEFGWDGAAGAFALVDPINRLSAFFAMHVLNYGAVYFELHPVIRDLLYEEE